MQVLLMANRAPQGVPDAVSLSSCKLPFPPPPWQPCTTADPGARPLPTRPQCPGLSDNQKAHIAELVVEAARNAEKAAEKAAQKRAAGGSGSVPPQSGAGQANGGLPGIASLSNDDDWQVTLDPNLNDSADGADLDVLVNPGQGPAKRPRTDGPADERDRQVKIEHQFQQAQSKQIRQQQQKHQQRPSAPAPAPVALPVLAPAPAVGPISHRSVARAGERRGVWGTAGESGGQSPRSPAESQAGRAQIISHSGTDALLSRLLFIPILRL